VSSEDPKTGIDFAAARSELEGLPPRRLDSDWLAVDGAGHVALFCGNERGPIPISADTARVADALEVIARAVGIRRAAAIAAQTSHGYRGFADRTHDPIFDLPRSSRGAPTHEAPLEGYPLLVMGTSPELRELGATWEARDVAAREGIAIVFPGIGSMSYEELHDRQLCDGCRVLDDPADPRPRAPEALAAAGLYVYAHVGEDPFAPYRRVAGPSVAAEVGDLEPAVQSLAVLVSFALLFENEASLRPREFLACEP
jgi:hypothetical protein